MANLAGTAAAAACLCHSLQRITMKNRLIAIAAAALAFSLPAKGFSQPLDAYEAQARQFKPVNGLAAANSNDVRRFVYDWFTHFEHAAPADFYLSHLDDKNMSLTFPGMAPLTSHAAFTGWYGNMLAQTLWNFHDVSALQIKQTAAQEFLVSFVIDWYGEVKPTSTQLAGWQSRSDSNIYHHKLRQTWTVKTGERMLIEKLVVTGGDTPSPINA
jgi:hypothetical protein